MAQGINGHVTINVGLASGNGTSRMPSPRRLGEDERNRRALRLRREGWSYRRIATTLGMSYAAVCRLLDADEARLPMVEARLVILPPPPANDTPSPVITASSPGATPLEELSRQVWVMQQRLDAVLTMSESHRLSLARLERVLVATLQNEHRALGQRLSAAIKALLERMLPTGFRARSTAREDDTHD